MTRLQEVTLEQASLLNDVPVKGVENSGIYVIKDYAYIMDLDMENKMRYTEEGENPYFVITRTGFFTWESCIDTLVKYDTVIKNTVTGEEYLCNREITLAPEDDYHNIKIDRMAYKARGWVCDSEDNTQLINLKEENKALRNLLKSSKEINDQLNKELKSTQEELEAFKKKVVELLYAK